VGANVCVLLSVSHDISSMPKTKKSSRDSGSSLRLGSISKPSKKRLRLRSSDDDEDYQEEQDDSMIGAMSRRGSCKGAGSSKGGGEREKSKSSSCDEIKRIKQQLKRAEAEKQRAEAKLVAKRAAIKAEKEKSGAADKKIEKLKKEGAKLKKTNERLGKEKEEATKEARDETVRWRKKCEGLKLKMSNIELEKVKLESKISSLSISSEPVAGPSGMSSGGPGLFQDMLDNFRELAETQLQCAVCSELFVEATSINCGHTFCHYCINEWKKKKANCPVCRADIKQTAACKVLDEYTDKLYDQFVAEGGKQQRKVLKEEREKIKKDAETANQARTQSRRERAQARRAGGLEMVNIVVNRARRAVHDSDDSSLDSDATLELHLSDGLGDLSDTHVDSGDAGFNRVTYSDDSDDSVDVPRMSLSSLFEDPANSDSDSSDEDFRSSPVFRSAASTDSVSDSTDSPSSPSSPDSSSDSDSDF